MLVVPKNGQYLATSLSLFRLVSGNQGLELGFELLDDERLRDIVYRPGLESLHSRREVDFR